jgi:dephospho-CoA kinase
VTHVGLTGGIGSGKSSVARLLSERGAVVVDADAIAREVVTAGSEGLEAVVDEFGDEVLGPDGELDRAALAATVFSHQVLLARLEAIVHPRVRARREQLIGGLGDAAVIVEDIPLLVEKGMQDAFDVVVVVTAPVEVRVARLVGGRGMDEADVRARIASQAPDEARVAVADVVIDNSGSPEDLERQVDQLWQRLTARDVGTPT